MEIYKVLILFININIYSKDFLNENKWLGIGNEFSLSLIFIRFNLVNLFDFAANKKIDCKESATKPYIIRT